MTKRKKITSPTKQKVLLLLATGVKLGMRKHTLGRQVRIIEQAAREWRQINRAYLYRILDEFRDDKLVEFNELPNGRIKIVLTERGRERSRIFDFDKLSIPHPARWDGKWRLVLYDVPEKKKPAREALRQKLKELGFHEWQKSVWIHPFPCRDEIEFIIEFFDLRPYIRFGLLTDIINDAELRLKFNLV